jgi:hypothetical protein
MLYFLLLFAASGLKADHGLNPAVYYAAKTRAKPPTQAQ